MNELYPESPHAEPYVSIPAAELERLRAEIAQARQRIAELEQARRWIPVEERLPEVSGKYLIVTDIDPDNVCERFFMAEVKDYQWGYMFAVVTHWQPMPPGPDSAGGEEEK